MRSFADRILQWFPFILWFFFLETLPTVAAVAPGNQLARRDNQVDMAMAVDSGIHRCRFISETIRRFFCCCCCCGCCCWLGFVGVVVFFLLGDQFCVRSQRRWARRRWWRARRRWRSNWRRRSARCVRCCARSWSTLRPSSPRPCSARTARSCSRKAKVPKNGRTEN